MNHPIATTAGLVTVTAAASLLSTLAPAQAQPTCSDGSVRCPTTAVSPYAEPQPALDGRTLAQYLADHMTHRLA